MRNFAILYIELIETDFWAMLHTYFFKRYSLPTGNNCEIISTSHTHYPEPGGDGYSAPQARNFAFSFTQISKLIDFSRGYSSVYSAKFRMNDRLFSYEEDKTTPAI